MESPWLLKKKGLCQKGPIARSRAIFFFMTALAVGGFAIISAASCSHTSSGSGREATLSAGGSTSEQVPAPVKVIEDSPSPEIEHPKRRIEPSRTEYGRIEAENYMLKKENERLSSEVVRLNAMLAEANRTIYSLNRKLDAIFKPDITGE